MTETNEGTSPVRAFYPTDYAKFASVIKGVRASEGNEQADALIDAITPVLSADHEGFDAEKFAKSTVQVPAYFGQIARVLRGTRHVKCQPYTAAPQGKQDKADMLEAALTEVLAGHQLFDADTFHASAAMPSASGAYGGVKTAGSVDDYNEDSGDSDF